MKHLKQLSKCKWFVSRTETPIERGTHTTLELCYLLYEQDLKWASSWDNGTPAKTQASLRIRTVSPEPSLFAHTKYGRRRRVWPKKNNLAPLDGCACTLRRTKSTVMSWAGSNVYSASSINLKEWLILMFFAIISGLECLLWSQLHLTTLITSPIDVLLYSQNCSRY